jgi:hypothetical protein
MTEKKPRVNSESQKQLQEAEKQFEAFDQNIKDLTMDRMNAAPKPEVESQTKMSQSDIQKSNDVYLKPFRSVGSREKFNENYREGYNHDKEYVQFIAENKEIIGEAIDIWTKPYAGMPAEWWKVPCNKPIWGPRYLAEQIKRATYHRLTMQQNSMTSADGMGQYYGTMTVDTTIQRLDATPVSSRKSIFMGAKSF